MKSHVQANDDCPVPSPCNCFAYVLDCSSRGLTTLPTFTTVTKRFPTLIVSMFNNNISVVPNNAFSALKSLGVEEVTLLLSGNQIHTIQDNAFAGIEGIIKEADVENNHLNQIPVAFEKLSALHTLQMKGNELSNLVVTSDFGRRLTTFGFSAGSLTQWPSDLSKMTYLKTLTIDSIPFPTLAADAFNGLDQRLQELTITRSKLTSIPEAICSLKALRVFEFGNNMDINTSKSTPICSKPMINVETINIHDSNLKTFPDIFTNFRNAKYITVSGNPELYFIPSELVEINYHLLVLNLEKNSFDSVPDVVKHFRKLTELNLRDNLIRVVQGSMLGNLQDLKTVRLDGNPLSKIDTPSFVGLAALTELYLSRTKLSTIPKAISSLSGLASLTLEGNDMVCTCDLTEGEDWPRMNAVTIRGFCTEKAMSVQVYVRNYLGLC